MKFEFPIIDQRTRSLRQQEVGTIVVAGTFLYFSYCTLLILVAGATCTDTKRKICSAAQQQKEVEYVDITHDWDVPFSQKWTLANQSVSLYLRLNIVWRQVPFSAIFACKDIHRLHLAIDFPLFHGHTNASNGSAHYLRLTGPIDYKKKKNSAQISFPTPPTPFFSFFHHTEPATQATNLEPQQSTIVAQPIKRGNTEEPIKPEKHIKYLWSWRVRLVWCVANMHNHKGGLFKMRE